MTGATTVRAQAHLTDSEDVMVFPHVCDPSPPQLEAAKYPGEFELAVAT